MLYAMIATMRAMIVLTCMATKMATKMELLGTWIEVSDVVFLRFHLLTSPALGSCAAGRCHPSPSLLVIATAHNGMKRVPRSFGGTPKPHL